MDRLFEKVKRTAENLANEKLAANMPGIFLEAKGAGIEGVKVSFSFTLAVNDDDNVADLADIKLRYSRSLRIEDAADDVSLDGNQIEIPLEGEA